VNNVWISCIEQRVVLVVESAVLLEEGRFMLAIRVMWVDLYYVRSGPAIMLLGCWFFFFFRFFVLSPLFLNSE